MKRIAILGSTGSIGESTLKVARHLSSEFEVHGLAVRQNIDALEEQIREFNPRVVAVHDEGRAEELRKRSPGCEVLSGLEGVQEVAALSSVDIVVSAMTGSVGILPTLAAIEAGHDVALANKEVMVTAGEIVTREARRYGVKLIPVDSEHSAIFQCLNGENPKEIRRIILTASGGAFRDYSDAELDAVKPEAALKHPNWDMGPKVTVDSSTLMNKGLEVLEAHWLFDVALEQIEVVVHPQSIIHSMVEFVDGSIMAQMGTPDMVTPIQYALTYPERRPGTLRPFDFRECSTLTFETPNYDRFRCLRLAYEAGKKGGTLPGYMNAANEVLVERFLAGKVAWKGIATKLEQLMGQHGVVEDPNLNRILEADVQARHDACLV